MSRGIRDDGPLELDGVVGYPPEFAERYRAAGYWTGQTIDGLLKEAVRRRPDHPVVIDGERRISYAQLDARAERLAAGLAADGLRRGDRVVVQLPNVADYLWIVFALFRLGAIPVLALPAHRRREIEYFCSFSEAKAYVTCASHDGFDHQAMAAEVLRAVPSLRRIAIVGASADSPFLSPDQLAVEGPAPATPVRPSDVAFLQLSGGTTGTPKLIPRTHDDYLYSVRESARICGLDEDAVMLAALPISHNFTMSSPGLLGIIHAAGTVVMAREPSPATVFSLIGELGVTIVPSVPPLVLAWLNSPLREAAELGSLRVVQVGGAKLSTSVAERIEPGFGCRLQQVFGMAEGLVNYTALDDDTETVIGTQGCRISAGDEVLVVDDDDRPVASGTPGHLLTRGPYTIRGYYRAPEHNAAAFTDDGFYRTGDIVIERDDGYLTVVGRSKDQINRGGEKVAPEEVENLLLRHPELHDVSVVAVPDEVLGERVFAHVVLRRGRTTAKPKPVELRRFLAAKGLAAYKIPDGFAFVDELPETGVGKINKRGLREQAGLGQGEQ